MYSAALWPAFIGIAGVVRVFFFFKCCGENNSVGLTGVFRHTHKGVENCSHENGGPLTEKLSAFLLSLILLTVLRT